jgi:hypothetical protein
MIAALFFLRRDVMPIYISRGRFTANAVKGMLAKPENREEVVAKLFQRAFSMRLLHDAVKKSAVTP